MYDLRFRQSDSVKCHQGMFILFSLSYMHIYVCNIVSLVSHPSVKFLLYVYVFRFGTLWHKIHTKLQPNTLCTNEGDNTVIITNRT